MESKYEPLTQHLRTSGDSPRRMTFAEIERVLGFALPASARLHPAWWSNSQQVGQLVGRSGWRIQNVDLNATAVTFVGATNLRPLESETARRLSPPPLPPTPSAPVAAPSSTKPALLSGRPSVLDIENLMLAVARERPVFHSEADFQHCFAWILRELYPTAQIRLETRPRRAVHLDIAITIGDARIAVELKYSVRRVDSAVDGGTYQLPNRSAHDITRHDIIKDVWRIEQLVADGLADEGWAITLSNDPAYWKPPTRPNPIDAEFRIHEGVELAGVRQWQTHAGPGTTKGRSEPIRLLGKHTCTWRDYVSERPDLTFRWMAIDVHRA